MQLHKILGLKMNVLLPTLSNQPGLSILRIVGHLFTFFKCVDIFFMCYVRCAVYYMLSVLSVLFIPRVVCPMECPPICVKKEHYSHTKKQTNKKKQPISAPTKLGCSHMIAIPRKHAIEIAMSLYPCDNTVNTTVKPLDFNIYSLCSFHFFLKPK